MEEYSVHPHSPRSSNAAGEPVPDFSPASRDAFEAHYNRSSFLFRHNLHEHEIFSWSQLIALGHRHPAHEPYTYWSNGKVAVNDGWGSRGRPQYSLQETLTNIKSDDSLVMFKHLERDSVYAPFLREIQQRILDLAGMRMRNDVTLARGTILVASPWRITPYHIDADVNFLFQIAGDKVFRVFDQGNRNALSHQELENYFLGNLNGAVYESKDDGAARTYDLRPGCAIHIPLITGHWAQNQAAPSVALSVNFDIRSVVPLKRVYRVNGRLRKLGLNPVPPGISPWRDKLKSNAIEMLKMYRHRADSEES
jgi:hypothetical protein